MNKRLEQILDDWEIGHRDAENPKVQLAIQLYILEELQAIDLSNRKIVKLLTEKKEIE